MGVNAVPFHVLVNKASLVSTVNRVSRQNSGVVGSSIFVGWYGVNVAPTHVFVDKTSLVSNVNRVSRQNPGGHYHHWVGWGSMVLPTNVLVNN